MLYLASPRDDLTRWVVDCRRKLRVELPEEDGGTDTCNITLIVIKF